MYCKTAHISMIIGLLLFPRFEGPVKTRPIRFTHVSSGTVFTGTLKFAGSQPIELNGKALIRRFKSPDNNIDPLGYGSGIDTYGVDFEFNGFTDESN